MDIYVRIFVDIYVRIFVDIYVRIFVDIYVRILGENFKTDIFKFFYNSLVGDPGADSRLTGIPILTHIDRSGGKLNFENDPYFPIWQKFGFCDTSANMADFSAKMRAKGR